MFPPSEGERASYEQTRWLMEQYLAQRQWQYEQTLHKLGPLAPVTCDIQKDFERWSTAALGSR